MQQQKSNGWREHLSWKGQPTTPPTDAECADSCIRNAEESGRREGAARAEYDRLPPGEPRLERLAQEIARHVADQRHWRRVAAWYRERIAKAAPPPPAPDRRLPREVGEDDCDEDVGQ